MIYYDRDYAVVDGTLISYFGSATELALPDEIGGMRLHTIGQGAFYYNKTLKKLSLPAGIQQILPGAFFGSAFDLAIDGSMLSLLQHSDGITRTVTIDTLELPIEQYNALQSNSIMQGGRHILRDNAEGLLASLPTAKQISAWYAARLPRKLPALLFCNRPATPEQYLGELCDEPSEFTQKEHNGVLELIHTDAAFPLSRRAEADHFLSLPLLNWKSRPDPVMLFSFTPAKLKRGRAVTHAELRYGYAFWQSVRPITHNGRRYFVYRRHFLTNSSDPEYILQDVAVYTQNGIVTDKKEAEAVYAKYFARH